ncbi:MAG: triphosphoribosyl-dephospho-CoA synthase [Planctomycetota bacterium]
MASSAQFSPPLGSLATLACQWEATAAKPGNVYRSGDFADLTYADFLASGVAIGPVFDRAAELSLGELILAAVEQTQLAVATNTNLGTVLLLAPLAKAAGPQVRDRLAEVLTATTVEDAKQAYEAIRLAAPGGLGEADEADVAQTPTITLLEAMRLAEDRDLIARQYTHGFTDVLQTADAIAGRLSDGVALANAIVWAQLELMARRPDTLIARKCGEAVAAESADRAAMALDSVASDAGDLRAACAELDFWLRADGHRRNPGATADAIAAALFVLLIEEKIPWPLDFYGRRK